MEHIKTYAELQKLYETRSNEVIQQYRDGYYDDGYGFRDNVRMLQDRLRYTESTLLLTLKLLADKENGFDH